jgi:Cu2+-exporting ATPase
MRHQAVLMAFGFAVLYNIVVVAIALAGHMHPLLAAILMPLSSLATISLVALRYRSEAGKLKS